MDNLFRGLWCQRMVLESAELTAWLVYQYYLHVSHANYIEIWLHIIYLQPAAGEENPFGGNRRFISHLGGHIPYFKATGTSDVSHAIKGVVIAEHQDHLIG